ncbi:hypothetical protein BDD12DRAFT_127667 [Trichophaea hybrida]|nr:hypothetical protein BDD12DRAFT_127667 [Trichophaea hybrida]
MSGRHKKKNKQKRANNVEGNIKFTEGANSRSSPSGGERADRQLSTTNNKRKKPTPAEAFASFMKSQPDEILALLISSESPLSSTPGSAATSENGPSDVVANLRVFFRALLPDTKNIPKSISTMQEVNVLQEFGLTKLKPSFGLRKLGWIFLEPATPVTVSDHLTRFLWTYARNFERNSEALCRTVIDVMLNEALCCLVSCTHHFCTPPLTMFISTSGTEKPRPRI